MDINLTTNEGLTNKADYHHVDRSCGRLFSCFQHDVLTV
jgi:hypothetical protein